MKPGQQILSLEAQAIVSKMNTETIYLNLRNVKLRVSTALLYLLPDSILMSLFPAVLLPLNRNLFESPSHYLTSSLYPLRLLMNRLLLPPSPPFYFL
jgi:hypothetical protein